MNRGVQKSLSQITAINGFLWLLRDFFLYIHTFIIPYLYIQIIPFNSCLGSIKGMIHSLTYLWIL